MTMLHYLRSVVTPVRASGGPRGTRPSLDPPPFGNDHLSYARHVMVKNESDVSAWFNECLDTTHTVPPHATELPLAAITYTLPGKAHTPRHGRLSC